MMDRSFAASACCVRVGIIDIGSGRDRGKRSLHHVADRGRIFGAEGREETLPWIHVVRYVCPYPIEIRLIQKHSRMDEGGRRTGACVGRISPRPLRLHGACRRFRPALRVTRGSLGGRRGMLGVGPSCAAFQGILGKTHPRHHPQRAAAAIRNFKRQRGDPRSVQAGGRPTTIRMLSKNTVLSPPFAFVPTKPSVCVVAVAVNVAV